MKFFIDTANLDQIKEAASLGIIDGVTTNPSLIAKEGITGAENIRRHYEAICALVNGDVSAEVIATDFENMVREGEELSAIHPNIVVKVPITRDGLKALSYFAKRGIRTNCTLVFSAGQALLAAKAGATYVSPFIGRLDDISQEGLDLIRSIRSIYDNFVFGTKILAASIRSPLHIVECARIGVDVVTCPLSSLLSLLQHPLTDIGLEKFLSDHRKSQQAAAAMST
ncbi:MAG: fructose-6-phosphate aldolase [Flavobacteriales bacterium]|nr:fructose-6-phosphate aldolase [Flavobacteriales bacterium]MCX7767807.1 fructose-6-phosphate aldolase [Flavobacteriales bacterium]MDW8409792.1 fructose-6-phosphate aldolase [Flavobacteriales bacterium]